jgi:diguanylate cyclase
VLRAFGLLLNDIVRDNDIVARTGGEEFMILLPATVEDHAAEVADRIRHRFKTTVFEFEVGKLLATASFGVAEQQPEELIETTVKRADGRLYEAKNAGRNRVFASKDSDQIMISTRHKGTVQDSVSERQNPGTI